jgi:hypothetical protein
MYDLSGLGEDLKDLMVSGKEAAAVGASALVGAGIAVKVSGAISNIRKGEDERSDADKAAGARDAREKALPAWVGPLAPIAVGVVVHNYGKSRFPLAAPGVAAGMVAVGLGQLVGALFIDEKKISDPKSASSMIKSYVPFAGLGADVYDYSLMGFGQIGPGDVSAYMRLGSSPFTATLARGTSIMSPGAPVQITTLRGLGAGAPTQAQVISTTPSMSAALVG